MFFFLSKVDFFLITERCYWINYFWLEDFFLCTYILLLSTEKSTESHVLESVYLCLVPSPFPIFILSLTFNMLYHNEFHFKLSFLSGLWTFCTCLLSSFLDWHVKDASNFFVSSVFSRSVSLSLLKLFLHKIGWLDVLSIYFSHCWQEDRLICSSEPMVWRDIKGTME